MHESKIMPMSYYYCLDILLILILLYNPCGANLQEKKKVENLQLQYIHFFYKFLKSHFDSNEANKHLHKGIMLIQETQRIYELSKSRLILDSDDVLI